MSSRPVRLAATLEGLITSVMAVAKAWTPGVAPWPPPPFAARMLPN
jgi:hypothetical protein